MIEQALREVFPNYAELDAVIPPVLWWPLRIATLILFFGLMALLSVRPSLGLMLFWGLAVPALPAAFVLAPGLWRNICPLAFLNQLPRLLGFGLARNLPKSWQLAAPYFAILSFIAAVFLRQICFNGDAGDTALLLALAAFGAFLGGTVFAARSGWCGTFCPLGPIQRAYGVTPSVDIPQTYCKSCIGCQVSCQDLNPTLAGIEDGDDQGQARARSQQFFVGLLPGLLLAYFSQTQSGNFDLATYAMNFLIFVLSSLGIYFSLTGFVGLRKYTANILFAAVAVTIFYVYAGPIMVQNIYSLSDGELPWQLRGASQGFGGILGLGLLVVGMRNNSKLQTVLQQQAELDEDVGAGGSNISVQFADLETMRAMPGQNLLMVLEKRGVDLVANCRSGLCGSDAVFVVAGMENLSPPGDDEIVTLTRLGALGKARLACCCRVYGDVALAPYQATDERTTTSSPRTKMANSDEQRLQQRIARAIGTFQPVQSQLAAAHRVVIIGSGVAGITAADELRRANSTVQITLVSAERQPFYNRMALNKIIEGKSSIADLILLPAEWYEANQVQLLQGRRVSLIDRESKIIIMEDGQNMPYDKLILAMGATGRLPVPNFLTHRNCFVLRTAEDAQVIHEFIRHSQAKSCVVLGAGILGVETADVLARMGLSVVIAGRGPRIMDQLLDEHSELILQQHLSRLRITFKPHASLQALEGHPNITAARFKDGSRLVSDFFVACIGVVPNIDLARQAGLITRNGIVVDDLMRSSDPDILAIGDVAEPPGPDHERLWTTSTAHARQAISGLLGQPLPPVTGKTIMRVKCDDLEFRIYGTLKAEPHDEIVHAPPFSGDWWKVVKRGDQITGAVFIGPAGEEWPLWDAFRRTVMAQAG